MHNLLLISSNQSQIDQYLVNFSQENQIKADAIYRFGQEKPLSVEEFRQILKLPTHHFNQLSLFVLYNFDQYSSIIQNTFLKTLEEHQPNLSFVLIVKNLGSVLPTVISRCQKKILIAEPEKIAPTEQQELESLINKLASQPLLLASSQIKLGLKDKKNQVINWLDRFLHYGYFQLAKNKQRLWLSQRLKSALIVRSLIDTNNLDPELALDQVFLS